MSFLSDQAISIYSSMQKATKYCVVGGGISGVSCAQELVRLHGHSAHVTLLTESETIIGVIYEPEFGESCCVLKILLFQAASIFRVTDHLHELKVFERTTDNFKESDPLITIVKCFVEEIDYEKHSIHVKGNICFCTNR